MVVLIIVMAKARSVIQRDALVRIAAKLAQQRITRRGRVAEENRSREESTEVTLLIRSVTYPTRSFPSDTFDFSAQVSATRYAPTRDGRVDSCFLGQRESKGWPTFTIRRQTPGHDGGGGGGGGDGGGS